jgi:hypothetical protein
MLRRLRWAGHVAGMGERRGTYRILIGKPGRRNSLENPGVDGSIVLKWIFERLEGGFMDWVDLAQGRDRWWAVVNMLMNPLVFIKCAELFFICQ